MFKTLKVFADRYSGTIAVIGPRQRRGRMFEVINWQGFDASGIQSYDERLAYAHLFASAPEMKATNERLRDLIEAQRVDLGLLIGAVRAGNPNDELRVRVEDMERRLTSPSSPGESKPDLNTCPRCGGPADNGHDRCIPPSPYHCTKCMGEQTSPIRTNETPDAG